MAAESDISVISAVKAATAEARGAGRGLPPVHLWNPDYCGEMDLEIRPDGAWIHEGSPIGRPAMVRLFASVLKREGDRFFLVTPVEKLGIRVIDAPFLAIDADIGADAITFTTNTGDVVTAGPDNAIRVDDRGGEPRPYVHVRRGLDALIDRAVASGQLIHRRGAFLRAEAGEAGSDRAIIRPHGQDATTAIDAARIIDCRGIRNDPERHATPLVAGLLADGKARVDVLRVGLDAGMNTLIRPALYDAWHDIANLSRLDDAATASFDVVGPICESSDVFGRRRALPAATAPGTPTLGA